MARKILDIIFKLVLTLLMSVVLVILIKFLIINSEVNSTLNAFSENEVEVIEVSKSLLKDSTFSKEGSYLLSLTDDGVRLELLDTFYNSKAVTDMNPEYSKYFSYDWLDKNTKIQIDRIFDHETNKLLSAVTYKKSFFLKEKMLWIFYGDRNVFPLDYYDASPYDVTQKFTNHLYYFEPY